MNRRSWITFAIPVLVLGLILTFMLAMNSYLRLNTVDEMRAAFESNGEHEPIDFRLEQTLADAEQAVDLAFNLLGLFEALSLAVTIGGVVLAAYGLTNFNTAKEQLNSTRQEVLDEMIDYRRRFDEEINIRKAELQALRTDLEASAEREHQNTSSALLANALIPLGERQYKASDYTGALNTYNRALELDPQNPVVNQRLGYVHTNSGNLELAEQHYLDAIRREPDFAPALAGLGYVTRRQGERVEQEINKGDFSEDELLQKRIERDGLLNRAEDLLLQALKISPKLVDDDGESWWGVLGGLYKRRGQIEQAIEAYRQTTIVTPQSSYGFGNLALLYMKQNKRDEMIDTYRRVEQIASTEARAEQGNFWGYADLIVSSYAIGKIEQADECVPIAISIAPVDSPYMLMNLSETLQELSTVIAGDNKVAVEAAIERIQTEMADRAKENDA